MLGSLYWDMSSCRDWDRTGRGIFEEIADKQVFFAFVGEVIGCNLLSQAITDSMGSISCVGERLCAWCRWCISRHDLLYQH